MKKKIVSLLLAVLLITLTTFPTSAQPDIDTYTYSEDGEASTQHPENEALELTATPSTTETTAEPPATDPTQHEPNTASPEQEEIITFNIGGDGAVAKFVADNHALMLRSDGRLIGFGHNLYGQLGLGVGAPDIVYEPTEITFFKDNGLTPVDIAVCEDASFVICSNGETYSCGRGTNGRHGLGNTNNVKTWTLIPGSKALRFGEIHTGKEFVIAETDNNQLYAWGRNSKAQLGTGDKTDVYSPVKIMDNANVDRLNLGEDFVTLLKTDKTYWVWGNNERYGFNTTVSKSNGVVTAPACVNPTPTACTIHTSGVYVCATNGGYYPRHDTCAGTWALTEGGYQGTKGSSSMTVTLNEFLKPQTIVTGADRVFTALGTLASTWIPTGTANGVTNNIYSFKSTANCVHDHNKSYADNPGGSPCYPLTKSVTRPYTHTWQYTLPNAYAYFDTGKIHGLQVGNRHGLVDIDGTYYGWGDNTLKQQGTSGDANGYMVPLTQINAFIKNLDDTADGFNHLKVVGDTNFILSSGGTPYSWGSNTNGKAGLGSVTYTDTPTLITALAGKSIASIVGGRNGAFYIAHNGDVSYSGDNMYGQSGMGEAQKDTSKITTPSVVDGLKFSATELPPDAPGSLDTPHEVDAGQTINIQWSTVSSAAAYELKRYFTPSQQTFGLSLYGAEETEIVYSGTNNTCTDIAPGEAGTLSYSIKALNYVNDYSPAKTSDNISVLDNGSGNGGGNTNGDGNGNNNNGNGSNIDKEYLESIIQMFEKMTESQQQIFLESLRNNGASDELIAEIIAASKRSSSGNVNVYVPGMDKDMIALLTALATKGDNTGQTVPTTNVYNQPTDMTALLEYLGASEMDSGPLPENAVDVVDTALKVATIRVLANLTSQPATTTPTYYQPQQQNNGNQRYINIAVLSIILLLILVGCAVKFIPTIQKESEGSE